MNSYNGFKIEHEIQRQFLIAVFGEQKETSCFIYDQQLNNDEDGCKFTLTHKTKKHVNLEGGIYKNQKFNYLHVDYMAFMDEAAIDELTKFIENDFFQYMNEIDFKVSDDCDSAEYKLINQ